MDDDEQDRPYVLAKLDADMRAVDNIIQAWRRHFGQVSAGLTRCWRCHATYAVADEREGRCPHCHAEQVPF